MEFLIPVMIVIGATIILGLSVYAGWLVAKVREQTRQRQLLIATEIDNRNKTIIEHVDVIAFAALQEQCDLSEASIRLFMIMDHLQADKRVDFATQFPALFELFEVVKDMPRGEERKEIAKKQRMSFDLARFKAEAQLKPKIMQELEDILLFTGLRVFSPSQKENNIE